MTESKFLKGKEKRYNDFSTHFRKLFNGRVQKISLNAGFTCPNRDGQKGYGGCTYCNNKTFQPDYCHLQDELITQLEEGIQFFSKKYDTMRFLAYFQAYTGTYAPVETLKQLYAEALRNDKVLGLVIATRPDCLGNDVLDLFEDLARKYYIMVELGIESVKEETLKRINRGHSFEDSVHALEETARRGIHNCAHLILGLPGEKYEDFMEQARVISSLPVENIKLHQLQIHTETRMAKDFEESPQEYPMFTVESYVELVVDYLEQLRPSIVVERFVSSAPDKMVIAPKWGLKNYEFVAKVEKRLLERDTWQGKLYNANH